MAIALVMKNPYIELSLLKDTTPSQTAEIGSQLPCSHINSVYIKFPHEQTFLYAEGVSLSSYKDKADEFSLSVPAGKRISCTLFATACIVCLYVSATTSASSLPTRLLGMMFDMESNSCFQNELRASHAYHCNDFLCICSHRHSMCSRSELPCWAAE